MQDLLYISAVSIFFRIQPWQVAELERLQGLNGRDFVLRAGTRDDVGIRMERLGIRANVELRSLEYVCAIGVEVRGARALHGLGGGDERQGCHTGVRQRPFTNVDSRTEWRGMLK